MTGNTAVTMSAISHLHPPIFIVGSPRSGTSLLRLILTAHPEICIAPESLFFIRLRKKYADIPDLTQHINPFIEDLYRDKKFCIAWRLDRELLRTKLKELERPNYANIISLVYVTYMQKNFPEARIWGDKNPSHLHHIDTIMESFADARIIHIIRDIRSIYSSLLEIYKDEYARRFWKKLDFPLPFAFRQLKQVHRVHEVHRDNPQVFTVHYEDLVSKPVSELQKLCSWLNIDFCDSMLRFYENNAKKGLVASFAIPWEKRTFEPLAQDRMESWESELIPAEIEAIEIISKKYMKALGYVPTTRGLRFQGIKKIFKEYKPLLLKESKKYLQRLLRKSRSLRRY